MIVISLLAGWWTLSLYTRLNMSPEQECEQERLFGARTAGSSVAAGRKPHLAAQGSGPCSRNVLL